MNANLHKFAGFDKSRNHGKLRTYGTWVGVLVLIIQKRGESLLRPSADRQRYKYEMRGLG